MSKTNFIAALIVAMALGLAFFSLKGDSITTDESPHIPAGYSYLTQKDMRLNPEHPPLIKDLAAVPLLFQKVNFDTEHYSWKNDINGQWTVGTHFFYESGNNPDKIALSSRSAVLLIFILLSLLVFKIAKDRYGNTAGLIALAFTALSPNIIANARYVTTDIGASFGFLIAIYFFVRFLKNQTRKNLIFAGLFFGLAQLLKFSTILLIPLYCFILLAYYLSNHGEWKRTILKYAKHLLVIFVIGYLLVWPVYQYHVWNYPPERQKNDTELILTSFPFRPAANLAVWLADKPILRPYGQYFLGLLMVMQRSGGGNTAYFMGEVSSAAWKSYFPMVYLLKEPVPILILILIAFTTILHSIVVRRKRAWNGIRKWIADSPAEFTWISFIILYWTYSISGNLNIGLRHVLPTFPFIYMLTAGKISSWLDKNGSAFKKNIKTFTVIVLLGWLAAESIKIYPSYLAYFNQFAGGPANGYKYVADSNLDWGQDLKRLKNFVEKNNIKKIRLDYFGGGSPSYYLGDKYEKLDAGDISHRHGWLAISATLLQGGRGTPTKGFAQNTSYYKWLDEYEPTAKIGYSIFVYKID